MEKEQKKLLLVAVSVGVFLLVTITAAIVILTPRTPVEAVNSFSSSRPRVQAPEVVNVQPQPEITPKVDETTTINVSTDINNGDSLTINIPKPTTAAVPDNADITIVNPKPAAKPVAAAKPAETAKPAAPKTASKAKPASSAKGSNDYWVQTGAFTAIVRAQDVKETLAEKGITSIIENRLVDGKTWYRVRLGPYTSEKEANYWLALVKSIDGFNDSQVRQTVRQQ